MPQLRGRVLVIDDNEMWLEIFQDILRRLGLEVITAQTYSEAVNLLETQYFHLAVMDVRLEGDDSEQNTQGLDILDYIDQIGLGSTIAKIVITGFGNREWAREAFKQHDVYDFIHKKGPDGKGFDEEDFVRSIREAFVKKVKTNPALDLTFVDGTTFDQLALDLLRLDKDAETPDMLRWEIEDLLRKLFFSASSLTISRYSEGHSGSGVFKVEPFYEGQGQAVPVIVKYGRVSTVEVEADNFETYVRRFVSGQRYTVLDCRARTKSLGGIIYSFIGSPLEKMQNFSSFYARNDVATICLALHDLFAENCRKWYENRDAIRVHNMRELYWGPAGTNLANLESSFEQMYGRFKERSSLVFPGLEREFINPIYNDFVRDKPLYFPAYLAVTHGDLNGENLFVDHEHHTWLIDFARTGKGHIARDFVALESVVKFQLLEEESLSKLCTFEAALLKPSRFTDGVSLPDSMSSEMKKAFAVISYLRELAANVVKPSQDMYDYYAGLFYNALNLTRYYHLLQLKRKKYHILMSSALLCEKLQQLSGMH